VTNDDSDNRRARWRLTFDELLHLCSARPIDIDRWAKMGAFGPRMRERRDRGWHRHIDRTTAHRAVIMSRLVQAGFQERAAARITMTYEREADGDLVYHGAQGVTVTIKREHLP
jgi:hypothetical protein